MLPHIEAYPEVEFELELELEWLEDLPCLLEAANKYSYSFAPCKLVYTYYEEHLTLISKFLTIPTFVRERASTRGNRLTHGI